MTDYIKALSVQNIANLVYAQQCFHEPGMIPGFHVASIYDTVECIPDGGWIVWHDTHEGPRYDVMTNDAFRDVYVPESDMPAHMRAICDAHPDYDEWETMKGEEHEKEQAKGDEG